MRTVRGIRGSRFVDAWCAMADTVIVETIPPCDIPGCTHPARYDGKTKMGPWAYMCGTHFLAHGLGTGTGLGQELILRKPAG